MKIEKPDLATLRALAAWAGVTIGLLAFLLLTAVASEAAYARLHDGQVFPGVRVLGVRLDGLSKEEARKAVQQAVDDALAKGLRFRFRGHDVQIDSTVAATDPDASRDLVRYDIDGSIDRAFAFGRSGGWWKNVVEQIDARVGGARFTSEISVDSAGIIDALHTTLKDVIQPARDARFSIVASAGEPLVHIDNELSGITFDATRALTTLSGQAKTLSFQPIDLEERMEYPTVKRESLEPLVAEVVALLKQPELTLTFDRDSYPVPQSTVANWITVNEGGGTPRLEFNHAAVLDSLRTLAPTIEKESTNGSLVVKDGTIDSFVAGTQGVAIDVDATMTPIALHWAPTTTFPIIVKITEGSLVGEDPERLGIKELIGVGRSNFSGSPSNRRKNIKLGAQKVNGSLIPPGGEFSLLKTLGEIDGAHGWLPELVIKGDKTTPEFGGGLCQIGTTTFRSALNSGLKILERRNHSYRVRYYEPAGTDATIYDPAPDMRFQNDTGHHVLINTYIKGDDVTFEMWGTKDGRKVDPIKSSVYNVVAPPPMKLVETLDLPPGQKKCTESAHAGADASFTYHITYADGTEHKEVFSSHYRPWQAVCLVGVTQMSAPQDMSTNQSAVN